jgi:hypothetical protein
MDEQPRMTIAEAAYWAGAAPGLLMRHAKFNPREPSEEFMAALKSSQAVFRLLEEIRALTDEIKSRASVLTEPAQAAPDPARVRAQARRPITAPGSVPETLPSEGRVGGAS